MGSPTVPDQPPASLPPLRYHLVALCLWQEPRAGTPGWRFSLQHPHTGERVGFSSLAGLTAALAAWMEDPAAPAYQPGHGPPPTG